MNQFLTKVLPLSLALVGLTACGSDTQTPVSGATQKTAMSDLTFDTTNYTTQEFTLNGKTIKVRAFENIPYVANPSEPDYQVLNIYIPESYFEGKSINGYTADTAPIFFPNAVGGYMPAKPLTLAGRGGMGGGRGMPPAGMNGTPPSGAMPNGTPPNAPPQNGQSAQNQNSVQLALSRGYVVASAGARGRTLQKDGAFTGKAPAVIVDLKSAIRYLKANDSRMAGRADRIISNGTSAGGALSALLGASGNSRDFDSELQKAGAIMGVSDAVFAVSAYCPITNLDNADMAYEWQFNGINDYQKMQVSMLDYNVKRERVAATLTDEQQRWSKELKANFPSYINGLKLTGHNGQPLTLDKDGNGSFKDEIIYYLNQSANIAHKNGTNLNDFDFLAQTKSANPYYVDNFDGYLRYLGRGKGVPAFDGVDLGTGENNLFGNASTDNRHFTNFAKRYGKGEMAESSTVKLMNAMNYVETSPTAHWRIRHGAKDSDTSLAVPVILATSLANHGKAVDFALPWGTGHGGDYDLNELFEWADKTVKSAK